MHSFPISAEKAPPLPPEALPGGAHPLHRTKSSFGLAGTAHPEAHWTRYQVVAWDGKDVQQLTSNVHGVHAQIIECGRDMRRGLFSVFKKTPGFVPGKLVYTLYDNDSKSFDVRPNEASVESSRSGTLLWTHDGDIDVAAESLFPGKTRTKLSKLLAFINAQIWERKDVNGTVATTLSSESIMVINHHRLDYAVDPYSAKQFFTKQYNGKSGVEGVNALLQDMRLPETWEKICSMCKVQPVLPEITICASDNICSVKRSISRDPGYKHVERDGQQYLQISQVHALHADTMQLPYETFLEDRLGGEETQVHELFHCLFARCPFNDSISEGLAEAGALLYGMTFKRPFWDACGGKPPRVLAGSPGGFLVGSGGKTDTLGQYHAAVGWGMANAILGALGGSQEEQRENFGKIAQVSLAPQSKTMDPSNAFHVLPTVDAWLKDCDAVVPGFAKRLSEHAAFQAPTNGPQMLFFQSMPSQTSSGRDPWGVVTHLDVSMNPHFGYTRSSWNIERGPTLEDFDMTLGSCEHLPITVRVQNSKGMSVEYTPPWEGRINIHPRLLRELIPTHKIMLGRKKQEWLSSLRDGVRIEVFDDNGNAFLLGENFRIEDTDD